MLFLILSAGERRKLDIEYFSKLLEMILEVQKNRKKHKSLAEKNDPKKKKRRAKGICIFSSFNHGRLMYYKVFMI